MHFSSKQLGTTCSTMIGAAGKCKASHTEMQNTNGKVLRYRKQNITETP
jgi:hypothetical protein